MNSIYKKTFLLLIFLFCIGLETYAQRFYSVVFDKLPKDMQLYARDNNSFAEIPISGVVEAAGWDHVSVVTFRNQDRISYSKSAIVYGGKTIEILI